MRRPHLRRLLTLEAPVRTADGAGGQVESWVAQGALWAEVTASTGREVLTGGRERVSVSHKIVVRGAPQGAPSRPTPEQRFRDGARVFGIRAVSEADPDGRYLVCWTEEGTGA